MLLDYGGFKVLGIAQKLSELAVSPASEVTKQKAVNKRGYGEGETEGGTVSCSNAGELDVGTEVLKMQIKTHSCVEVNLFLNLKHLKI